MPIEHPFIFLFGDRDGRSHEIPLTLRENPLAVGPAIFVGFRVRDVHAAGLTIDEAHDLFGQCVEDGRIKLPTEQAEAAE